MDRVWVGFRGKLPSVEKAGSMDESFADELSSKELSVLRQD
jgi:hypothetical protein